MVSAPRNHSVQRSGPQAARPLSSAPAPRPRRGRPSLPLPPLSRPLPPTLTGREGASKLDSCFSPSSPGEGGREGAGEEGRGGEGFRRADRFSSEDPLKLKPQAPLLLQFPLRKSLTHGDLHSHETSETPRDPRRPPPAGAPARPPDRRRDEGAADGSQPSRGRREGGQGHRPRFPRSADPLPGGRPLGRPRTGQPRRPAGAALSGGESG